MQAVPIGNAPPIPAGGGGNPAPTPPAPTQSLAELRGQGLPEGFFDQPSAREGEPATAGLDVGAGPGSEMLANPPQIPDERSQILNYVAGLAEQYSSADAARILNSITTGQEARGVTMMGGNGLSGLSEQSEGLPESPGVGPGESTDEFASEEILGDDELDSGLPGDLDLDSEGDLLGDFEPEESAPEDISEGDDFDEGEEEFDSDYVPEGPSETEEEERLADEEGGETEGEEELAEEGEEAAAEESEEGEGEKPRRRRRKSGGEGE